MTDYFDALEAELRAAVPRVATASGRGRRPRPLRALVPALAVGVALAVAAAAVALLGHMPRPQPSGPGRQASGPSAPYPTLVQLVANFGVLRHAQTAADRSWRQAAQADGPLLARYTRQAARLGNGERVFLTVSRRQGLRGEPHNGVV